MAPRTSPAVVQLSTLPEFLRSVTVGELVAAALDEQAANVTRIDALPTGPDDERSTADAFALAYAAILTNASAQVRRFVAPVPSSSANGQGE